MGDRMTKTCTNPICARGGKLGLGTVSRYTWNGWWYDRNLFCGHTCADTHRAAVLEERQRQQSTHNLFTLAKR